MSLDTPPDLAAVLAQLERLAALLEQLASTAGAPRVEQEVLGKSDFARWMGRSEAFIHSLDARELCPEFHNVGDGRAPGLLKSEARAWAAAGFPSRLKWRVMREQALRRTG